jgi:hypothetical protein
LRLCGKELRQVLVENWDVRSVWRNVAVDCWDCIELMLGERNVSMNRCWSDTGWENGSTRKKSTHTIANFSTKISTRTGLRLNSVLRGNADMCMYTFIFTYLYMYVCMYLYMYVYTYVSTHLCIMHVCVCMYIRMNICMYALCVYVCVM